MEKGLFESLLYSESLLRPYKIIYDIEDFVYEVLSDELKSLISNFKREFDSPLLIFDIEKTTDYDTLKRFYDEYKKELKGIWKELLEYLFYKISRKLFNGKRKFGTKWDEFLELSQSFELLDITSLSEILTKEELSISLFTIFITFIIYELQRYEIVDRLSNTEKEICKKIVKWNPRVFKLFEPEINKNEKDDKILETRRELLKFFDERIKEIKDDLEKENIFELSDKLSREFTKILRFTSITLKDRLKDLSKKENPLPLIPENHIFYILKFFKAFEKLNLEFKDVEKDLKLLFVEGYKFFKGESSPFFDRFLERKILGIDINIIEFYSKNVHFVKEILQKIFELKLMEKKILIRTLENPYEDAKKSDSFVYFSLIPKGAFIKLKNLKRIKVKIEEPKKFKDFLKKYKNVISVLVYDIRGSTFMSLTLFNAERELSLKKKFQEIIKNSIISYGGFPVKETGDGGIAFFSENSGKLYKEIFEESVLSGHRMRFQKAVSEQVLIKPGENSGERALLCALELLEKSEEFIRKNYSEYRGFFPDALGIDKPLKSLFRLGIGIFSGKLEKDIYLSFNSYGDFDIQGPVPNLASILSEIRFPEFSSILFDVGTLANILINSNILEVEEDIKEIDLKDLLLKGKTFKIKNKNFLIRNLGYIDLEEGNKDKIFKMEEIKEIDFLEDFFVIGNKKGILIYGGRR
ncbi:MAG: hypothetical protein ABIM85_00805 [candidate division WOR-3 bacterium]